MKRLAIALLVALPLLAQPAPPPELAKALELIDKGEHAAAIELLEGLAKSRRYLRTTAWFHIAASHALRKNDGEAFRYLQMIRDTGSFDMDRIAADARFASIKDDPRLAALMPKASDFEKPFVEKTKVLHEFRGEAKGAQFGWIARRIGDVDGDKVADFTTSAPTHPVDGKPAGRVYVYSSKSGKLLWQQTAKAGEMLGIGVEAAGDVNGDKIPDVIAGAPGSGFAYVYSGKDGALLHKLGKGDPAENFGRHTAGIGDVNGDKHGDVLVGAPGAAKDPGRAYVFSGKDGGLLLTLTGEAAGDGYGSTVGGDLRGTFLVGAPGAGPRDTGRVYVYEGIRAKPKFIFDADETGAAFGMMFLSVVGDVDRDKVKDFYVSDWANNANAPRTGRIYVYSGKDGKPLMTLTGEAGNDGFGIGVADAGDVDRDGHDDLIVGAWQHAGAGKVYVYSGKTAKLLRAITCRIPGDTFGFDTTNVGDVDGDDISDFLLTSAWSGVKGFQSGRVFIISGAAGS